MIIKLITAWFVVQVFITTCLWLFVDWKKERERKAFANQPIEVLKNFMLMDLECSSYYWNLRTVFPDERATNFAIERYLIKNGLIGYRDDEGIEG